MPLDTHLEGCTIVWLCPLEIELRAAIAMLDRIFDHHPTRVRGQQVVYTIGEIGDHKVAVVGYYQEQGLAASGSMAAEVIRDLPNLQFGLLVGVAGGIPSSTNNMQLGDVAVAIPEGDRPGIVGYDLGKEADDGNYELKHWQNSTHPLLRSVINVIRARNDSKFKRHLCVVQRRPEFERPDLHVHENSMGPKVHYGTILSGNTVIKSQSRRDQLRDMYGGIAVEMEAAGIMTRLPVAVIRGISDFADSSKDKSWQPYAAIAAAAYAKEVLLCLPCEEQNPPALCPELTGNRGGAPNPTSFADKDIRLARALPDKWAFVGRQDELRFLNEHLGYGIQQPIQRTVVCLWGLTGIGKSQLAAQFVNQQSASHQDREIFWIDGGSPGSFMRSVTMMLKNNETSGQFSTAHPMLTESSESTSSALVNLFFTEIDSLSDGRWLLVIDGVSTLSQSTDSRFNFDIHDSIRRLGRGFVLLTSRRRDVVEKYHPILEVKGLRDEDAMNLLRSEVHPHLVEGASKLVSLLKGQPLALRLAISVISRYRLQINEYLESWKSSCDASEVLGTDETLYRSMALSLEELEKIDPIGANILTLFSFLDHGDLWYEICYDATGSTFPLWLQTLAKNRTHFKYHYPLLADLSFIEMKIGPAGTRMWEIHPAIQAMARERARINEQEYIHCAVSLIAAQVPRSSERNSWMTMRRLAPHVQLCWSYIKGNRWGPRVNLAELEGLARVFRQVGRYEEASVIYRMIVCGLQDSTVSGDVEFQADALSNLGLVFINQRKFAQALRAFDRSTALRTEVGALTDDVSMAMAYNKGLLFMMTDRLREAEELLRNAAMHFSESGVRMHSQAQGQFGGLHLRILNDLGEILMHKGNLEEAFDMFQRIKLGQRNWQGGPCPAQMSLKLNMGRVLTRLGNFSEARDLLTDVIVVYTDWWGRHHPETMRAIDELAWSFMTEAQRKQRTGEANELEVRSAKELWNEALEFYRCTSPGGSDVVDRLEGNLLHLDSCHGPASS